MGALELYRFGVYPAAKEVNIQCLLAYNDNKQRSKGANDDCIRCEDAMQDEKET